MNLHCSCNFDNEKLKNIERIKIIHSNNRKMTFSVLQFIKLYVNIFKINFIQLNIFTKYIFR